MDLLPTLAERVENAEHFAEAVRRLLESLPACTRTPHELECEAEVWTLLDRYYPE